MKIRIVTLNDAQAICEIYNHYIENTAVTFETQAVSESEMRGRIRENVDAGYPYFVGEADGRIVGYCYTHRWNNRCSYATTQEVSIYLDPKETGKGYGSMLFKHLLDSIDKAKTHTIVAGICIPNEGSVRLHEKFGFRKVSHFREIGKKFEQWRDVGHWQLLLNEHPKKVLILCTGNSCRSQMAHGFLQSFDPDLIVCSAGTKASGRLNPMAIEVMKEAGVDISHHTSDSVEKYLNDEWDYVITVCGGANENCPIFTGKVKHRLHIGFDDPSEAVGTPQFIHSEFIRVRDEIRKAFYELYQNQIKMKQSKAEIALSKFKEGYNCAQSVAYAFADDLSIDKDMLLAVSTGFGAGFGKKQETCGAVTGAILVLGAKFGRKENEPKDKTEATYAEVRKFIDEFTKEKGSTKCSDLLPGCVLATEEGQKLFREKNLAGVCNGCIELACTILEKQLDHGNR